MAQQFQYSSIFGELTKAVQIRFDAASALHKQLFDNVLFENFLDWDTPTIGLEFEEIIGQYITTIAAATIGDQSKEPILGTEGLQTLSERVLNHALTLPMTIQEYRKILQLQDSRMIADQAKKNELIKIMWGNVERPVKGVLAKLDMIFLGALSNKGIFPLDENNNPEGGVRATINYNQPAENLATSTTAWTQANLDTVDCFEDIQAILDAAQDKVALAKALLSPALISYMCRSKKMKQMIWGTDKSAQIVQLRDINAYMQSNGFPIFEPIRRQIIVQNGTERKVVTPWSKTNIVFVPEGKIGVVKNAWANSELRQEPGVTYSNYGRIRVSQWGVGETQNSNGVEFTKAEVFALPVITEMNGINALRKECE